MMANLFIDSFRIYFKHAKVILALFFVSLFALFISYIANQPAYYTFGAIFLRTYAILYADLYQLLVLLIGFVAINFLASVIFTGLVLLVRAERLPIKFSLMKEIFGKRFYKVFLFFLFISSISLIINILFYIISVPSIVYAVLISTIFYILFFVPYAMVIDDYSLDLALDKGIKFLKKKPFSPLILSLVYIITVLLSAFLLSIILPYDIVEVIMFLLVSLLFLPFFIIAGALIYMKKYPIWLR